MRAVARSSNHGERALKRFHLANLHTTVDRTHDEVDRSGAPNLNPSALYSVACDHERVQDHLSISQLMLALVHALHKIIRYLLTVALPHSVLTASVLAAILRPCHRAV
jgi:hypothetical protein